MHRNGPVRILLVEDNRHDYIAFRRALQKSGKEATIRHFVRAEEALDHLTGNVGSYDLVVADHNLPAMTGLEFCERLLKRQLRIPVVLLTGQGNEHLAISALKAGVSDYIIKDPQQGYLELLPMALEEVMRRAEDRRARFEAEKALRKSQAILNATQKIARIGGWETYLETGEQVWTEEVYRIREVDADFQPTLEKGLDFFTPESRPLLEAAVNRAVETGEPWDLELEMDTAKGRRRWVRTIGKALQKMGKTVKLYGSLQDITDRKRLESELIKAKKIEATGVLAGGIAHDFNNLLFVILGNIDLAKEDPSIAGRTAELLTNAQKAGMKARDLTHQFITFSSGGEPVRKRTPLDPFLSDILRISLGGSNLEYQYTSKDALRDVEVDRGQMSQVLYGIIDNAKQAMSGGGILRMTAENVDENSAGEPVPTGRYVRICVIDQGDGIPHGNLQDIFDPYFSTKQRGSQRGMGLGLAIAYSIVKNHGGRLEIDSRPGEGTRVMLYLPALPEKPAAEKKRALSVKPETGPRVTGPGRILVMDDEAMVRKLAQKMLDRLGYTDVSLVRNGEEAITQYREAMETRRPFDLVILDLTIKGGMGGVETIRKLRQIDPDVTAVIASGYLADPKFAGFNITEFKTAIAKPYSLSQLESVLNRLLGTGKESSTHA